MSRTIQEIAKARMKYGAGAPCVDCGQPTDSVSKRCERCVEAHLLTDELTYMRNTLRERPRRPLEIGHDRTKRLHLVMFRIRNRGWCGAAVTQMPAKRTTTPPGMFPPGLCAACLTAYEGM